MILLEHLGYAVVYSLVGLVVLGLGYKSLDLATPGHLGSHIYEERSANAAIVLAAGFLGLGAVIFTAIWTNGDSGFGPALGWSAAFGLLGVVLQAIAFRLLDFITPGDMAAMVTERDFHPASLVAGSALLASSMIVIASIS